MLAFGFNVISPEEESVSRLSELLASRHPCAKEMDAYERVLSDAMAGDATLVRPRGLCRGGVAHR